MAKPSGLSDWSTVVEELEFIEYLALLHRDLRAPQADGEASWAFTTVPEFMHGWARWIDDALSAGQHEELLTEPSWASLAGQLFRVRTARPRPSDAGAETIGEDQQLASVSDLAAWLRFLGDDCIESFANLERRRVRGQWASEGDWAHGTDLTSYFEAWHACMSAHYEGARRARFSASSWPGVASMLLIGKVYE